MTKKTSAEPELPVGPRSSIGPRSTQDCVTLLAQYESPLVWAMIDRELTDTMRDRLRKVCDLLEALAAAK